MDLVKQLIDLRVVEAEEHLKQLSYLDLVFVGLVPYAIRDGFEKGIQPLISGRGALLVLLVDLQSVNIEGIIDLSIN